MNDHFFNHRVILAGICAVFVVLATLTVCQGGVDSSELLQDQTPYVPDPAGCMIEPRPIPSPTSEGRMSGSESIDLTPDPNAPSVDQETAEEIMVVVSGAIACTNAGDILRSLAYFTDFYVDHMFVGPEAIDFEGFLQYLTTPVATLPLDEQVSLVSISDFAYIGGDDVVSAVVVSGDPDHPFTDRLTFVSTEDGWRITAWEEVSERNATPTP